MKTRSDFVTNSSSSSYVIAFREMPKVDQKTLDKYPWISTCLRMIKDVLTAGSDYGETTTGEIVSTIDELDKRFIEDYGWMSDCETIEDVFKHDDEGLYELYQKMRGYIEDGMSIIFKQVDYSDDVFRDIVSNLAQDNDNIVVIVED